MFSPFSYSFEKERVGGSNDDKSLTLNGRSKVRYIMHNKIADRLTLKSIINLHKTIIQT